MTDIAIGRKAPEFALPSTSGDEVTLSQHRGESNVLLAFFPLAFTGTCTAEMCDFTNALDEFREVGSRVYGISVDSIPTLTEFKAKHGIGVDLLSDFKREVCWRYGTLLEEQYFSSRSYFVVDKEGVLKWMYTEDELGQKRDNSELIAELKSL